MSDRYRDDRYSPPPRSAGNQRWVRDSYERRSSRVEGDRYEERDRYVERDRDYYEPRREPSPRRRETRVVYEERERYDEPYRPARRFDIDEEPRNAGQIVRRPKREDEELEIEIKRRERERERGPPDFERPKFIRRQSSLDTYDRKPMPRYGDVARVREEEVYLVPAGRRRSPPRYREDYEDIRISEQDRYGREEDFVQYRERETSRVRRDERSEYEFEEREEIVEETPAPKRGKTKMPMRLVNTEVLVELGYPFEQENETIIILKALHKNHIDEVIALSRERNARRKETKTTYIVEGRDPGPREEEKIIEKRTEIIREVTPGAVPSPTVPRSVREWDVLSKKTSSRISDSSSSTSPTRTLKTHVSRARSASVNTRQEIIISNERDESATIRAGVGALIIPDRSRRKSRDIHQEIALLQAEKRALRRERASSQFGNELILRERSRSRGPDELVLIEPKSRRDDHEMVVLTEKGDEVVEVKREKRAPDPRLIKGMMWTLT